MDGIKVFGNPVLGYRTEPPLEEADFCNFLKNCEKERLELKETMRKEIVERFG